MALRWVGIVVLFFTIFSCMGLWRWSRTMGYPMGAGTSEPSPNGRYVAHASNMVDKNFWGTYRYYYEFEIRDSFGNTVHSTQVPPSANPVDFYANGMITWAPNSASVSFGPPQNIVWSTPVP